ncbi:MAG: glycosyltransferase family 2 protein [Planctomycetaceae bacterium]
MKFGRLIGDVAQLIPGVSGPVQRVRFAMRKRRTARRQMRDGGPECRYETWVRWIDTPSAEDLMELRARAAALRARPVISLLMPTESPDPELLDRAIRSVRGQVYPAWELCIVAVNPAADVAAVLDRHAAAEPRLMVRRGTPEAGPAEARNAALEAARGDLVAVLDPADVLPPQALVWIADAVERHPQAGLVYADEDRIDRHGRRHTPWFKCDANRELLLAHDAISRPAAYPRRLVRDLGGWRDGFAGAEDYDLALRAVAAVGTGRVVHVPRILCHRGDVAVIDPAAVAAAGSGAVADLLARQGAGATVEPAPEAPGCNRIRHPLPPVPPLVSIIICTRDHERLLRVAVDSITSRTTYPRYEILIIDNGSVDPGTVALLADLAGRPGIRVLRDDSPFNYSRLNNRAAAAVRGEVLCLLNDDIEVLTPGWLEEMVSFAVQPDVGAVGARLWYPDGTLQHGGVIVGICGGANHAHPRLDRGDPGYFGRAVLQQELSAVTAACLVVRADTYADVAGLDERIEVAFNDVDFCLRLRQAGYRNVWTPYAELIHHESASRGIDDTPVKRARSEREIGFLRKRWGDVLLHDPFYNPNLSHGSADFSLDAPRRRSRAA